MSITGGIGTKALSKNYPIDEGLEAETTKQTGERFLRPEQSLVSSNDKVGL